MFNPGIIAADNSSYPTDATIYNVVIQGSVGGPEQASQQVIDGFMTEAGNLVSFSFGYFNVILPVGEVLNGRFDYLLS